MKFVSITKLTITWCYLSTKTKLYVAAMKCPALQVCNLQINLRCSWYVGGFYQFVGKQSEFFIDLFLTKTMVTNSWRRGRRLPVVILKKLKTLRMLMKLGVKTNVMRMKIAITYGTDRQIKNACCIALVIHWSIIIWLTENCLRRN